MFFDALDSCCKLPWKASRCPILNSRSGGLLALSTDIAQWQVGQSLLPMRRRRASVGRARPRAAQNLPQKRLVRDGGEDADADADVADADRAGPSGAAGPSHDAGAYL